MSATLVSSNTTIKVNAAVSASQTANNSTVTLYTAPANGYAIVQLYFGTVATGGSASVAGRIVLIAAANATAYGIYIGPSQALTVTSNAPGNVNLLASGVEFVNTP